MEALTVLGERVRPVTLAGDRRIAVAGPAGALFPGGGLRRGSVVTVEGAPGEGSTSLLLELMAAVTRAGEWVAVCEAGATSLAVPALAEAGVVLERVAVVSRVPRRRRADVLATLVEGVTLVVAGRGLGVRGADARRLAARARERGAVLVAMGGWEGRAEVRLRAHRSGWVFASGRLAEGRLEVEVEHRGRSVRRQVA